ncbi:MAG TPA: FMN-binding protein [Patescibacteria group bacterium]|nr:FMN-binding protein [Patescibacteria group bacterium]
MKRFALSAFVVITFIAYVLNQKLTGADGASGVIAPLPSQSQGQTFNTISTPTATASSPPPPTNTPISHQPQPAATSMPTPTATPTPAHSGYKDGQFTGNSADAYYGNIQVKITIQGGKITDVQFLDYPHDRNTSIMINSQAMPYLKSEAIQAQSAQVDIVSGATDSSLAFRQSLQSALDQAR